MKRTCRPYLDRLEDRNSPNDPFGLPFWSLWGSDLPFFDPTKEAAAEISITDGFPKEYQKPLGLGLQLPDFDLLNSIPAFETPVRAEPSDFTAPFLQLSTGSGIDDPFLDLPADGASLAAPGGAHTGNSIPDVAGEGQTGSPSAGPAAEPRAGSSTTLPAVTTADSEAATLAQLASHTPASAPRLATTSAFAGPGGAAAGQSPEDLWFGDPRTDVTLHAAGLEGQGESGVGAATQGPLGVAAVANILVNNPTHDTTQSDTQSETTMVVFGSTILVGFNDSGSNAVSSSKFTGWARSTDGGETFTDLRELPTAPGGDRGDPVMARDAVSGRVYFATLGSNTIQVWRSDDGGATFGSSPANGTPGGSSEDKQWMAVDNFAGPGQGNVYLVSRRFGGAQGIYFFRSTDQGVTFGPNGGTLIAAASPGNVQGAWVAVGPDHTVYAFWFDNRLSTQRLMMRKSTDLGLTFGSEVLITNLTGTGVNGDLGLGGFRSNKFLQAVVNPVSGHIYVVYPDDPPGTDRADIFLQVSTDGGSTWGSRTRVNDDTTTRDQFQPTIAVTPNGTRIGVSWYDRRLDTANNLIDYFAAVGRISGSTITFEPNVRISDTSFPPVFGVDPVVNPVYMGDYDQSAADNQFYYVTWADNRDFRTTAPIRRNANVRFAKINLGMSVVSSTPGNGAFITDQPTNFVINFSDPYVSDTVEAADLLVNGTPANSFTLTDSDTVTFHFESTPVLTEGPYTIAMDAGAVLRQGDDDPLAAFTATFFYDLLRMQVVATSPTPGANAELPLPIRLDFNEPYDPASIGTNDLTLTRGTLTGFTLIDEDTVEYTVGGVFTEGAFGFSMAAGAVTDVFGNPILPLAQINVTADFGTVAFPTPLTPKLPLGSLIYDPTISGTLTTASDVDSFTVLLDAGQTVTALLSPVGAGLRATLTLRDPTGEELAAETATLAGRPVFLQTLPVATAGLYTFSVSSAAGTGTYTLQVFLNAALENERFFGSTNDALATAQSLENAFVNFASVPSGIPPGIAAVIGRTEAAQLALPAEIEPNNSFFTGNIGTFNFSSFEGAVYHLGIAGNITSLIDSDWFNIGALQTGDVLTVSLSGPGSLRGTLTNPLVELYRGAAASPILVTSDDTGGPGGIDALIWRFEVTDTDTYFVRARAFATQTGTYQLGLYLEDADTPPLTGGTLFGEAEPNNNAVQANNFANSWRPVQFISRTTGAITTAGDTDFYRFQFNTGDLVTINVDSTSALDARVFLRNPSQTVIAQEDGFSTGPDNDSPLYAFRIPAAGLYGIQVAPTLGTTGTGAYTLEVLLSRPTPPPPAQSGLDFYSFTLEEGDSVTLALFTPSTANIVMNLVDESGTPVPALTRTTAANVNRAIASFVATTAGTYAARVGGPANIDYNLVVTRNLEFDIEPNNTRLQAQGIGGRQIDGQQYVLGHIGAGLSLVAQWNHLTPSHQYSDVWAEGNFAYLAHFQNQGGVDIVDISDSARPRLVSTFLGPADNEIRDVHVQNGIGFFSSDNFNGGVYVVDVSNPASPTLLSRITAANGGYDRVHTLSVEGNYLYLADSRTPTVKVIDISDPRNPRFVRNIVSPSGGPVHEVTAKNGRLYTAVINSTGHADIFDISNVETAAPLLGTFVSGPFTHTTWPTDDGRHAIVARETTGGDIRIFDISNPAAARLVSTISLPTTEASSAHQPVVVGNLLYVAWYQAGLLVYDITDPANPVQLGRFDTFPGSPSGFNGAWGVYPFLGQDRLLVGDTAGGLFVLALGDVDTYAVTLAEGATLTLQTQTPAGGPGEFVNTLNPRVRVFDAAGNLVAEDDDSAADGRNALLSFPVPEGGAGTYFIEVSISLATETPTRGEYLLLVGGTTGSSPFQVTATTPADGARVRVPPAQTQITVDFNDSILTTSVQASDLTLNGVAATAFTIVDFDTVRFTVTNPATDGPRTIAIAAGAIFDIQGTPLGAFSATFTQDATAPRIISVNVQENQTITSSGSLSLVIQFDEPMRTANLDATDFTLRGIIRGFNYTPTNFSYDATGRILTINYDGLRDDRYTLTLLSADGRFEDVVGFNLDGEVTLATFPIPPGRSGNGFEGGNFVVNFTLDTVTTSFPSPLQARQPLGSLVYGGTTTGQISPLSDSDSHTINLDPGQTMAVIVRPLAIPPATQLTLRPTVAVFAPSGILLGSAAAPAIGQNAVLFSVPTTEGGEYTITVSGDDNTIGGYSIELIVNAALEAESNGGAVNDALATAQNLNAVFQPLVGSGPSAPAHAAVLGRSEIAIAALPNETEPNNTQATANNASRNFTPYTNPPRFHLGLKGTILPGNDVDWYNLGTLNVGDIITISMSGSASSRGTLTNPLVELYRGLAAGPILVTSDDDGGPGADALLYRFAITTTDTYWIRARAAGTQTGTYDLGVFLEDTGLSPATGGTVTIETEPNNSAPTANNVATSWRRATFRSLTNGTISAPGPNGDNDFFLFEFNAGDLVTFNLDSTSAADARVFLRNAAGVIIAQEDGTSTGPGADSGLAAFIIPTTGTYFLQVQSTTGTGTYVAEVFLSTATPPRGPGSGFDYYSFSLAAGESATLAVSGNVNLQLLDGSDTVLAFGRAAAGLAAINNFVASTAGTYYARVSGPAAADYGLVITRNADFDTEPNDPLARGQFLPSSGVVAGHIGAGSPTIGPGTPVPLPRFLFDGTNFQWDISGNGSIGDGSSDAYDGGLVHRNFPFLSSGLAEDSGREIVIGPATVGGASVTRKIFIPSNQGYARFLEIVTNPTASTLNYTVFIDTNLGSDGSEVIVATSSGDTIFNTADDWIITDDSDGFNDPTLLHIIAGPGGRRPTTATQPSGSLFYSYALTLAPGETQIIMHFASQNTNRATALAKAPVLAALGLDALAGMDSAELSSVVNFALGGGGEDFFRFAVNEGDELTLTTSTPGQFGNNLDPLIELYDPDGVLVASDDNGAPDGRNALLNYTALSSGVYAVRVASVETRGEYILSISGNTGAIPAFQVTGSNPANNFRYRTAPTQITIDFNDSLLVTSLQASDLTVDGQPATGFTLIDGDTVRFDLPADVLPPDGNHTIAIAAGAILDLQGTPLEAFAIQVVSDQTPPRIISADIQPSDVRPAGTNSFSFQFSEAINTANLDNSDFTLLGIGLVRSFTPLSRSYDTNTNTLTLTYNALPADTYVLTLLSGNGRIEDPLGWDLDGEPPDGPIPPNQSGNGVEGGNFFVIFAVQQPAERVYWSGFEFGAGSEFVASGVLATWSNATFSTTPGTVAHAQDRFRGEFTNTTVTLGLSNLAAHSQITVSFDLYVIRSWDGNSGGTFGPDIWSLAVDGETLLGTTFCIHPSGEGSQAYPDGFPGGEHPCGTGAAEEGTLGYTFNYAGFGVRPANNVYRLSFTFAHSSDALTLGFAASGLQGIADESWGLDNVIVSVGNEPGAAAGARAALSSFSAGGSPGEAPSPPSAPAAEPAAWIPLADRAAVDLLFALSADNDNDWSFAGLAREEVLNEELIPTI